MHTIELPADRATRDATDRATRALDTARRGHALAVAAYRDAHATHTLLLSHDADACVTDATADAVAHARRILRRATDAFDRAAADVAHATRVELDAS